MGYRLFTPTQQMKDSYFKIVISEIKAKLGEVEVTKNILILTQHFYPEIGSAGNRMKNLYQLLVKEGHDVDVVTVNPSYPNAKLYEDCTFWDDDELNNSNENVTRLGPLKQSHSRSMIKRLIFFITISLRMILHINKLKKDYDYIYVSSPPIFVPMVGLIAKYILKSKLVLEIRDLWPESLKGVKVFDYKFIISIFSWIEKKLYKKSDVIVVNSMGFIDHIRKVSNIPEDKLFYLPNAARASEINSELSDDNTREFKVIYTGNVGLAQDVNFLKECAKKLMQGNIGFTIIGYGVKIEELKKYVEKEKLTNVLFVNPLTRKQCLIKMKQHDVGIVSLNDKEVFDTVLPGKLIDYMTCNIPIVGSVSGYSKDVILNNKIGFVSEERNVDEIFKYILYLKENPKTHKEMVRNCECSIRKEFLWEENIKLFEKIFKV